MNFLKGKSPAHVFSLLTLATAAAFVVPVLFMDGMFLDGVLYAAVSRNLADGSGTFWHPHFSTFYYNHFHEQPPLVIALQSVFYDLPGNSIFPERIYDLLLAIINGALMVRVWKRMFEKQPENAQHAWIPVFLFFVLPVTFWAFDNNVIEITMSAFVLASTDAFIAAFIQKRKVTLNMISGIAWLIAASLCKGPQGLFPLAIPFAIFVSGMPFSFGKMMKYTLLLLLSVVLFYVLIWQIPAVPEAYRSWYESRIVNAFNGQMDTSSSHFHLLFELLLDLLPAVGFAAAAFALTKKRTTQEAPQYFPWIKFMLVLGMAGSLPLMVTREQRGFYLLTSLPYYCFAFALFMLPAVKQLGAYFEKQRKLLHAAFISGWVLLCGVIIVTLMLAGTPKRDADWLNDVHKTGAVIGQGKVIRADQALLDTWQVQNYYSRLYHISLGDSARLPSSDYAITLYERAPAGYEIVPLRTKKISLWRKTSK